MKCSDARFLLAADPRSSDPTLLEHLELCAACAAYAGDMHEIERQLGDALRVPVPERSLPIGPYPMAGAEASAVRTRARRRFAAPLALAASVAGIALVTGLLWGVFPRQSLASAVVAHMAHEPDAWQRTEPVRAGDVQQVISSAGIRIDAMLAEVTYANSCWFRGHYVPHLVVQTDTGPVTIMVLTREHIAAPTEFAESGYRGVLVPAPRGSLAVIAHNAGDVGAASQRALAAVSYVD